MAATRSPPSSTMQRTAMTVADAERFLATNWCILEEHGLESPIIAVRQAGALIDIFLSFSSAADCALVEKRFEEVL